MMAGEGREPLVEPALQRLGAVLGGEVLGEIAHQAGQVALRDQRRGFAQQHGAGAEAFDDEAERRQNPRRVSISAAAAQGSRSTTCGEKRVCRSMALASRWRLSFS